MPDVQIRITNLPQIEAAFKLSPELMAKELNQAIAKAMFTIQGETILNVSGSRGINVITGGLSRATERSPKFEFLKSIYEINIPYGVYVHDGTYKMPARPFLQDAVDSEQEPVNVIFREAVQKVLDTIGGMTL